MKKTIFRVAAWATANRLAQATLGRLVSYGNRLRGFGGGAGVIGSGETVVFQYLPPDAVIFDVGANRGDYAQAALRALPSATLHCFEPSKETFTLLQENLRTTRCVMNNIGLAEAEKNATLFSPAGQDSLASISKRRLEHFGLRMDVEETVTLSTFDRYCREHGIEKIDLLKVDVEGHEIDVLRGAAEWLSAGRVRLVAFEFGGSNIDSRVFFQDIFYLLKELGMKSLMRITPAGHLIRVPIYTEELENYSTTNYLVGF